MDQIWTRINELAEANNGFVRTAQVEALGISRPMLRKYTDAGKLEQVRKGLYVLADGMPDEYALLQGQCRDAVFSYGTDGGTEYPMRYCRNDQRPVVGSPHARSVR